MPNVALFKNARIACWQFGGGLLAAKFEKSQSLDLISGYLSGKTPRIKSLAKARRMNKFK